MILFISNSNTNNTKIYLIILVDESKVELPDDTEIDKKLEEVLVCTLYN